MPDEELRRIFTKNLNAFLSERGYKQADLARAMGVSTTTTAKWCTGKAIPRIDKIQSICNWLGIEKEALLNEQKDSPQQYYLGAEAKEYAQFLFDNPEYRVLFDASRKVKPEDIDFVRKMIDRMTE